jgi:hypothetical protein
VLQLTYHGPTPEVAAGTLRALIDEFNAQRARFGLQRSQTTIAYYRAELEAASRAVVDAHAGVADYMTTHPAATSADPHLQALMRAEKAAGTELASATAKLNQVSSDLQGSGTPATGMKVIDAPRVPDGPVTGRKMLVLAVVGGLFAGCLISILGLVALTPAAPSQPELPPADVERMVFGDAPTLWQVNGDAEVSGEPNAEPVRSRMKAP